MKSLFLFPLYTQEYLLVFTSLCKVDFSLFYQLFWIDVIFNRIYSVFTALLLLLLIIYRYVFLNTQGFTISTKKHKTLFHCVETHKETSWNYAGLSLYLNAAITLFTLSFKVRFLIHS